MKSHFKGGVYKDMLWKAARATTVVEFNKEMDHLKYYNSATYDWLMKIPAEQWSRSHFSGKAQYGLLLHNICEVFYRQLNDVRDGTIITCLEYIREYLMKRIVDQCVVNMDSKECGCRKWELTGIPCKHAVAAINYMNENGRGVGIPEQWVHAAYRLETWACIYSFKINGYCGRDFWPIIESTSVIIPPIHKPQVDRPTKKKKSVDELAIPSCSCVMH
ncbi:transposase, mutator type [Artemisia annua]|uniref:Transposase, mutator type n=1 Tax=Artemisia annua TaxID=35608 RepID=A0A2U1KVI5_ARTAN|nr:transposase, mutator type [Artemisia annua]